MYKYILYFVIFFNTPLIYAFPPETLEKFRIEQIAATAEDNISYKYRFMNLLFSIYCCSYFDNKQQFNQALNINAEKALALVKQWAEETQDEKIYFKVGSFYDFKLGIGDISEEEAKHTALDWWGKAANLGDGEAQNNLGFIYSSQRHSKTYGATMNIEKAIYWYEKAIQSGDTNAVRNLAKLYLEGKLVVKDTEKALAIFQQALSSDVDHREILTDLVNIYLEGRYGVNKDCQLAKQYFKKLKEDYWYTQELGEQVASCATPS